MTLTPKDIRQIRDLLLEVVRGVSAILIEAASRDSAPIGPPVPVTTPPAPSPPRPDNTSEPGPRLTYTIAEAAHSLSLGRSTIYKLIGSGDLQAIRIGGRRLIPAQALHDFLSKCWSA